MKYWRKHVFKPLVYADGYMAPSLSKVSHSWLTMIKFSPSPSLHSSTLTPTFYIPTAAPWQPLALAPAEHWGKCSFLPHAHLHHWDSLQLHSTKPPSHCPWWQPWAVLSSQHQEDATCPGLGGSEILSVSLLPAMLWRGFSKLLIIQKPRAHIFCMQWFLLLNGSWCFTWRRAPFFYFVNHGKCSRQNLPVRNPGVNVTWQQKIWFFMPSSQKFANMKTTIYD